MKEIFFSVGHLFPRYVLVRNFFPRNLSEGYFFLKSPLPLPPPSQKSNGRRARLTYGTFLMHATEPNEGPKH